MNELNNPEWLDDCLDFLEHTMGSRFQVSDVEIQEGYIEVQDGRWEIYLFENAEYWNVHINTIFEKCLNLYLISDSTKYEIIKKLEQFLYKDDYGIYKLDEQRVKRNILLNITYNKFEIQSVHYILQAFKKLRRIPNSKAIVYVKAGR